MGKYFVKDNTMPFAEGGRRDPTKSKLADPAIQEKLSLLIQAGAFVDTAIDLLNLPRRTFYYWMERGAEEDAPEIYANFHAMIRRSEAQLENLAVSKIMSSDDPRIALDFLARRFPKRWRKEPSKVDDLDKQLEKHGLTTEDVEAALMSALGGNAGRPQPTGLANAGADGTATTPSVADEVLPEPASPNQ